MIHRVEIHCDIVHPASGEVLAETGETLGDKDPRLVRAFNVVLEYPDFYTYQLEDDKTHIRCISSTESVKITDSEMNCQKCGKSLTPEVYWYGNVLQVLWYCADCKCGYVRDVYFTGDGAPSPFEDANLKEAQK